MYYKRKSVNNCEIYINRGRRKVSSYRARIEDVYASVFTVKSCSLDLDSIYTEVVGRRPCKLFPLKLKSKDSINIPPNCCFMYKSESFTDDISTLHETLLEYGWIDSKTTVDMLLRLFSGKGCMDTIKWLGSPGILQEIIKPWIKNEVITAYPNGIGHWPVVSQRFIDKKNHPMKELGHEEIKQKRNRAKIDEVVKILTR